MKKLITLFLTFILALSSLTLFGCVNPSDGGKTLSFYAPDGAPALAIAKLIKDKENFGIDAEINYNVVSANDIGGIMQQGKGEFIIMPINAATKLYKANADSPYVMTAVVTHGNLYIVSNDQITLDELKGKVIGVIGQGLVPDLTLKAVLKDKGLLDSVVVGESVTEGKITIRYFANAQDMLPMMKQGKITIGLLPEPAATKLKTKVAADKTWHTLDLQELYDSEVSAYPQAVLMVRKSVYQPYKTIINKFGEYFTNNVAWVKANTLDAISAINSALPEGVTPSLDNSITPTVIDNCKIFYQDGASAKEEVEEYINKIIAVNPQSAKAVQEDFFAE